MSRITELRFSDYLEGIVTQVLKEQQWTAGGVSEACIKIATGVEKMITALINSLKVSMFIYNKVLLDKRSREFLDKENLDIAVEQLETLTARLLTVLEQKL